MLVTLVVHLVRERLTAGEVVGHVELVETGERAAVRCTEELVGFARRAVREDTLVARSGGER